MVKVISDKAQILAVNDATAAKLYTRLETVHAQVTVERGPKRVAAVDVACELVSMGYSLRKAAKAAGKKADNRMQRYFEVAKARMSEGDAAIAPPEGFGSWVDAIAAVSLETMTEHIRASKRTEPAPVDGDKAIRAAVNAALGKLASLVAGEATGKAAGFAVGKAQLTHYVKAFIAAGFVVDGAKLDKLALTAQVVPAAGDVSGIAARLAESLAETDAVAVVPVAVNE